MDASGRDGQMGKPVPARWDESKARAIALFGMSDSVAWVAEDAFVTREGDDILVEKWVGARVVSILVRRTGAAGPMAALWRRLTELAGDAPEFSPGTQLPWRAS